MYRLSLMLLIILLVHPLHTLAAPDPDEVEEIKTNAPLHLVGSVIDDRLVEDLSEEKGHPYQIRMMELSNLEIIKNKSGNTSVQNADVYYTYYPTWIKYDGAARMDIAVGDRIEIWLEHGENGWEPALSGSTVEHIHYADNRTEHIPERYGIK